MDQFFNYFYSVEISISCIIVNKTNDPILNLTPENITQHSGIE